MTKGNQSIPFLQDCLAGASFFRTLTAGILLVRKEGIRAEVVLSWE